MDPLPAILDGAKAFTTVEVRIADVLSLRCQVTMGAALRWKRAVMTNNEVNH